MNSRKNWIVLIEMLIVLVFVCSCCSLIPPSPTLPPINLTPEELAEVKEYSWGINCLVRWPEGDIYVYDETNFPQIQRVLDSWNQVLQGKVNLILTNDPSRAEIKVILNNNISSGGGDAAVIFEENDWRITYGEIEITEMGRLNFGIYLHEFGHILGIRGHTNSGIMAPVVACSEIDPFAAKLMQNIYSLPIGYPF